MTLPAPFAPLAIGLAVVVGAFAAGPFTGGAMNPARALGPAIAFWNFKNIWVYLLANFMGGMSGAVIYENLFLEVCSPLPLMARARIAISPVRVCTWFVDWAPPCDSTIPDGVGTTCRCSRLSRLRPARPRSKVAV